jgi:ATP/maltotriose-dependent transcriptional regulator MalT
VIRAAVAVQHGEPLKAIDALRASVPYEMGSPRSSQTGFFGSLYPVFFRGEALLAAHKGAEAANEFQKTLSLRGIMIGDPVFVLAHLGLARAYALSGESARARAQYEEFFALWKNADPVIPILKQAKAEYANPEGPACPNTVFEGVQHANLRHRTLAGITRNTVSLCYRCEPTDLGNAIGISGLP